MANYNGDTTVIAARALAFFQQVVFGRKVKKVFDPNVGYSSNVGLSARFSSSTTASLAQVTTSTTTAAATTSAAAVQVSDSNAAPDLNDREEDETQVRSPDDDAGSEDEAEELTDAQQEEAACQLVQSMDSIFGMKATKTNGRTPSSRSDDRGIIDLLCS